MNQPRLTAFFGHVTDVRVEFETERREGVDQLTHVHRIGTAQEVPDRDAVPRAEHHADLVTGRDRACLEHSHVRTGPVDLGVPAHPTLLPHPLGERAAVYAAS